MILNVDPDTLSQLQRLCALGTCEAEAGHLQRDLEVSSNTTAEGPDQNGKRIESLDASKGQVALQGSWSGIDLKSQFSVPIRAHHWSRQGGTPERYYIEACGPLSQSWSHDSDGRNSPGLQTLKLHSVSFSHIPQSLEVGTHPRKHSTSVLLFGPKKHHGTTTSARQCLTLWCVDKAQKWDEFDEFDKSPECSLLHPAGNRLWNKRLLDLGQHVEALTGCESMELDKMMWKHRRVSSWPPIWFMPTSKDTRVPWLRGQWCMRKPISPSLPIYAPNSKRASQKGWVKSSLRSMDKTQVGGIGQQNLQTKKNVFMCGLPWST